jgi:hypothetical protein
VLGVYQEGQAGGVIVERDPSKPGKYITKFVLGDVVSQNTLEDIEAARNSEKREKDRRGKRDLMRRAEVEQSAKQLAIDWRGVDEDRVIANAALDSSGGFWAAASDRLSGERRIPLGVLSPLLAREYIRLKLAESSR